MRLQGVRFNHAPGRVRGKNGVRIVILQRFKVVGCRRQSGDPDPLGLGPYPAGKCPAALGRTVASPCPGQARCPQALRGQPGLDHWLKGPAIRPPDPQVTWMGNSSS